MLPFPPLLPPQAAKRSHVTGWLQEFSDDVRALVRGACDEVLDGFLGSNGIQADHKMTFMERAALRTECRKLTKYIRLTDFLVRDTLLGLALESTGDVLKWVSLEHIPPPVIRTSEKAADVIVLGRRKSTVVEEGGDPNARVPLFRVEVAFDKDPSVVAATEARVRHAAYVEAKAVAMAQAAKKAAERKALATKRAAAAAAAAADGVDAIEIESDEEDKEEEMPFDKGDDESTLPYDAVQLVVSPPVVDFKQRLREVVSEAVSVVSSAQTLMTHPDLSPYTQAATDEVEEGSDDEEQELGDVVKSHTTFVSTCEAIDSGLERAFRHVLRFCDVFTPHKRTFIANEVALGRVEDRYDVVNMQTFENDIGE